MREQFLDNQFGRLYYKYASHLFWCIKVSDVIIYNLGTVCYSDRSFKKKMNKLTWILGKAIGSERYGSDLFTNFSVTVELHPSAACKYMLYNS